LQWFNRRKLVAGDDSDEADNYSLAGGFLLGFENKEATS